MPLHYFPWMDSGTVDRAEEQFFGTDQPIPVIRSFVVTVNGYTENQDFTGAPLVLDQMGEPDSTCKTLQGDQPASGMLDVATLETLHAKIHG